MTELIKPNVLLFKPLDVHDKNKQIDREILDHERANAIKQMADEALFDLDLERPIDFSY